MTNQAGFEAVPGLDRPFSDHQRRGIYATIFHQETAIDPFYLPLGHSAAEFEPAPGRVAGKGLGPLATPVPHRAEPDCHISDDVVWGLLEQAALRDAPRDFRRYAEGWAGPRTRDDDPHVRDVRATAPRRKRGRPRARLGSVTGPTTAWGRAVLAKA